MCHDTLHDSLHEADVDLLEDDHDDVEAEVDRDDQEGQVRHGDTWTQCLGLFRHLSKTRTRRNCLFLKFFFLCRVG